MTACPPTIIYLTALALKSFNRSSKSEVIGAAWLLRMDVHDHLPCRLENCPRTKALPVTDVKRPVHIGQLAVAFHHKVGVGRIHVIGADFSLAEVVSAGRRVFHASSSARVTVTDLTPRPGVPRRFVSADFLGADAYREVGFGGYPEVSEAAADYLCGQAGDAAFNSGNTR